MKKPLGILNQTTYTPGDAGPAGVLRANCDEGSPAMPLTMKDEGVSVTLTVMRGLATPQNMKDFLVTFMLSRGMGQG